MTIIAPRIQTTQTTGSASTSSSAAAPNELGKQAFLKLMIDQMKAQDPLSSSGSGADYLAQLAQFTQLEQLTNLNATLTESLFSSAMSQGVGMIGHQISYVAVDDSGNSVLHSGTVASVGADADSKVTLTLDDGTEIALRDVREVR